MATWILEKSLLAGKLQGKREEIKMS